MEDKIFEMLINKDELTWQTIIYDLVNSEELDPWNIDISTLTQRYLETIDKMRKHSFFISGKILLASAILLRLKSHKLLSEHIAEFDSMLFPSDEDILHDDSVQNPYQNIQVPSLLIKTPQSRKRQLTLNDLMEALEKALEIEDRRIKRYNDHAISEVKLPEKKIDITELIKSVYERIVDFFKKKENLTFSELVGSDKKEDKIITFIPLLHLDSQQKIDLQQEKNFSEINIVITK